MTARTWWVVAAVALVAAAAPPHAPAQDPAGDATRPAQDPARNDLAAAARASDAPAIRFGFPARAGVCSTGDGIVVRSPDGGTMFISGRISSGEWRRWKEGEPPCRTGDLRVRLERGPDGVSDVSMTVGQPDDPDAPGDLGFFTAQAAADYLLAEARTAASRAARDLMLAASLGRDVVTWPALLDMARDRSLATRTRRAAIQHLGRQAAAEAARELGGIVRDRTEEQEIREAAVFGLSQQHPDRAVPLLIEVYHTVEDPRIRGRALFWLAEFDDERVMALFEQVLVGG